jgi:hypothetical protein
MKNFLPERIANDKESYVYSICFSQDIIAGGLNHFSIS